jgi:AmiR/NasT family two-component response regulator
MQISVFYHSPENGEYLCQVVMSAAGINQVGDFRELLALSGENQADVVLVEYQDNNPDLDNWIVQTAGKPQSPEVFLFMDEESPFVIWRAVKLGAREIFCRTMPPEDLQEALARVELRQARLRRALGARVSALAPASGILRPLKTCRDQVT